MLYIITYIYQFIRITIIADLLCKSTLNKNLTLTLTLVSPMTMRSIMVPLDTALPLHLAHPSESPISLNMSIGMQVIGEGEEEGGMEEEGVMFYRRRSGKHRKWRNICHV